MFVSHVDESGKGGPVFVSAGVTAKAESWLDFSDAWDAVLKTPPEIPFFHLAELQGLSKEEHKKKIDLLIPVINSFVERADLMVIDVPSYKSFFQGKMGITYDNPFMHGYMGTMQQISLELPDPASKVEFIFDEMTDTEYLELLSAYRNFVKDCPNPAVKERFSGEPQRRNDKIVLPLQAADLIAGSMLRAYQGDRESLGRKMTITDRAVEWNKERLEELFSYSSARAPGIESGIFYEDRKTRSSRLATARELLRAHEKRKE